jgi:electron transport complex protein RnfC
VQYPQGGEKQLIAAVTGREVPSCALPIDVGCVVQNVGTAMAVYEAVQKNKPLIERVVTVTGKGIARPSNFLARIGTPVSALIEAAGGMPTGAEKVIGGGPMMGRAMSNIEAPVTKGTSGILVMSGSEASRCAETDCIKCGKCVSVCPMGLEPYLLSQYARKQMWAEAEAGVVVDCIECGSCAYTCPARVPLLDWIRLGKTEVNKIIRARLGC